MSFHPISLETQIETAEGLADSATSGAADLGKSWRELSQTPFEPPEWLVEELLVPGFYTLVGRPKDGKSLWSLGLCVAVASGRSFLEKFGVRQGGALYVSYEDDEDLVRNRLHQMIRADVDCGDSLRVICDLPLLDKGGKEQLEAFFDANPGYRILVIDTLMQGLTVAGQKSDYSSDLQLGNQLREFALRHKIAVIAIHHARKGKDFHQADSVRGTAGFAGATSGYMVLERTREPEVSALTIRGKRVPAQMIHMTLMPDTGNWIAVEAPDDGNRVGEKRLWLRDAFQAAGEPLGIPQISTMMSMALGEAPSYSALKKLLVMMVRDGELDRASRGLYVPGPKLKPRTETFDEQKGSQLHQEGDMRAESHS